MNRFAAAVDKALADFPSIFKVNTVDVTISVEVRGISILSFYAVGLVKVIGDVYPDTILTIFPNDKSTDVGKSITKLEPFGIK